MQTVNFRQSNPGKATDLEILPDLLSVIISIIRPSSMNLTILLAVSESHTFWRNANYASGNKDTGVNKVFAIRKGSR